MAENSKIEWCDHTLNPWEGCQKVGPGCDHCYAEARNARFGGGTAVNWGPGAPRRRTSEYNWKKPIHWNANHESFFAKYGRRQRVFCASLADVFDNEVDPAWRAELFRLIHETPNLDWLLLTKRIGNARAMIQDALNQGHLRTSGSTPWPWPQVWIGATIVNQEEADRDIPKLLAVPACVRFLSMEPLLGPVTFSPYTLTKRPCVVCQLADNKGDPREKFSHPINCGWRHDHERVGTYRRQESGGDGIDWIIAGGESGPGARPTHPNWLRSLRDQCKAADAPFMHKQNGEWLPVADYYSDDAVRDDAMDGPHSLLTPRGSLWYDELDSQPPPGTWIMRKVGKKRAGRLLDGILYDEYPGERKA